MYRCCLVMILGLACILAGCGPDPNPVVVLHKSDVDNFATKAEVARLDKNDRDLRNEVLQHKELLDTLDLTALFNQSKRENKKIRVLTEEDLPPAVPNATTVATQNLPAQGSGVDPNTLAGYITTRQQDVDGDGIWTWTVEIPWVAERDLSKPRKYHWYEDMRGTGSVPSRLEAYVSYWDYEHTLNGVVSVIRQGWVPAALGPDFKTVYISPVGRWGKAKLISLPQFPKPGNYQWTLPFPPESANAVPGYGLPVPTESPSVVPMVVPMGNPMPGTYCTPDSSPLPTLRPMRVGQAPLLHPKRSGPLAYDNTGTIRRERVPPLPAKGYVVGKFPATYH